MENLYPNKKKYTKWLVYGSIVCLFVLLPFLVMITLNRSPVRKIEKAEAGQFAPDYTIYLSNPKGNMTIRNRILTAREYYEIGLQSAKGKTLHEATYVGILPHGTPVKLLQRHGVSLQIQYKNSKGTLATGYIAISSEGVSSLQKR